MASNGANTGDAGQFVIVGNEVAYNVGGNWSDISWAIYLNERYEYNYSFGTVSGTINATVNGVDQGQIGSGSAGFDWRGGGLQSTLIASGTTRFGHKADGTSTVTLAATMGNTGTAGAGGPVNVSVNVPTTPLKQKPGVPNNVSAARVSDTQGTVSWANTGANNAGATKNQVYCSVNNGPFSKILDISVTTSTNVVLTPNNTYVYQVSASNSAGTSDNSASTD